ncbi:MAG: polysaccharide deacetylase family protein [Paucibacter sp.]|nr:polysaccharide deacetylase family protein [Roseateles sp.]
MRVVLLALTGLGALAAAPVLAAAPCAKPVFLSFDTGHMGVAPLISDTLRRFDARATFFLANEPTQTGGWTLDEAWAPWWRERAAEGHDFGAHTWNHDTWLADLPTPGQTEVTRFKVSTAAGIQPAVRQEISAEQYCASLKQVSARFAEMTGRAMGPIFRAPGGKTSPALLAAAQKCGYVHVGWSAAGFLGDELPSDKYPNQQLLERALKNIRPGDILMAHLGIWSRQDAWAPAVLEPLLQGLTDRGMCFAPLREHPRYSLLFKMSGLLSEAQHD